MKFILTSSSNLVTESWSQEFEMKPTDLKVAFIDTAAEVYNKEQADWLQADRQALITVGFSVTDYTLTDKTEEDLKNDLADFEILFVSGGNTFYLLEKAIHSGFVDLIKNDFFPDKVYVGSSAGSVLLSNDIEIIKYLDSPDKARLTTTQSIGIFDCLILPHWGSETFKSKYQQLFKAAYEKSVNIMTISDTEYLLSFSDKISRVCL